jgi:hypothetical protein
VFLRVLLVGFGLFGPGVARAPILSIYHKARNSGCRTYVFEESTRRYAIDRKDRGRRKVYTTCS